MTETGTWQRTDSLLALLLYHLDASDQQLADAGVKREDVLALIRELEADMDRYRQTELNTIAAQMVRAFVAGLKNAEKRG